MAASDDFFEGTSGALLRPSWRSRKLGTLTDPVFDAFLHRASSQAKIAQAIDCPRQRVLIVGVVVPGREADMEAVRAQLSETRHECTFSFVQMQAKGKFDNVNDAIAVANVSLTDFDWLIVTDDDIAVPPGFLDTLIGMAVKHRLDLAQPAHRFYSYTSWRVTKRAWGSLVRRTKFCEIGPLTLIGKRAIDRLVPFPSMRWCWGLDAYWAFLAERLDWRVGIVDACPLEHRRPVANSYSDLEAKREGRAFLAANNAVVDRRELVSSAGILSSWW